LSALDAGRNDLGRELERPAEPGLFGQMANGLGVLRHLTHE
jgi:hypothetical protein